MKKRHIIKAAVIFSVREWNIGTIADRNTSIALLKRVWKVMQAPIDENSLKS